MSAENEEIVQNCIVCERENSQYARHCDYCFSPLARGVEKDIPVSELLCLVCPSCESIALPNSQDCSLCDYPFSKKQKSTQIGVLSQKLCGDCGILCEKKDRFCRGCGHKFIVEMDVDFYNEADLRSKNEDTRKKDQDFAVPFNAKVTLVKGHTNQGTNWHLTRQSIDIGREKSEIHFSEDRFLNSPHFSLYFENDQLWAAPSSESSLLYVAINDSCALTVNEEFIVGLQRFCLREPLNDRSHPVTLSDAQTQSVKSYLSEETAIVIERLFEESTFCERFLTYKADVCIGRKGCDLNFPLDPYISTNHAQVSYRNGAYRLIDAASRNGTFLRITGKKRLQNGDALMFGEQVFKIKFEN